MNILPLEPSIRVISYTCISVFTLSSPSVHCNICQVIVLVIIINKISLTYRRKKSQVGSRGTELSYWTIVFRVYTIRQGLKKICTEFKRNFGTNHSFRQIFRIFSKVKEITDFINRFYFLWKESFVILGGHVLFLLCVKQISVFANTVDD